MRTYETLLIAPPDFEKKDVTKFVTKAEAALAKTGAKIGKITEWGRKKLAFEIKKETEGYYILLEFEGVKDSAKKFGEFLRLQEDVLRSMTTRKLS